MKKKAKNAVGAEKSKPEKSQRASNIELLRIISVFTIILFHMCIHSGIDKENVSGAEGCFIRLLGQFGNFGNYNFMLISGYFLCKKKFSVRRVFKILFQVWFFSWLVIYILICAKAPISYIIESGLLTPIIKVNNWYPVAYLMVYLVSDILNAALEALSAKKLMLLLTGALMLQFNFVIFDFRFSDISYQAELYNSPFILFCTLYMVGGWIRLNGIKPEILKKAPISLLLSAAAYIANIAAGNTKTILVFLASLFCFIAFLDIDIGSVRIINLLASCSFGVYLFHENSEVRELLWSEVFGIKKHLEQSLFIPYCIGAVMAVYIVSVIADLIRQRYFSSTVWNIIDNKLLPFLRSKRLKERSIQR